MAAPGPDVRHQRGVLHRKGHDHRGHDTGHAVARHRQGVLRRIHAEHDAGHLVPLDRRRLRCRRTAQPDRCSSQSRIPGCRLRDPDELPARHVGESLARVRSGPPDGNFIDARGAAEADVQFHRVRAERSTARHGAVDFPPARRECHARADRRAVALRADEPQVDPAVRVAGILEQPQRVPIRLHRAADFGDDVLVAVAIEIGEGDAVSLVQLAGARGRRRVREGLPRQVQQQLVRHDRRERRAAHAEVDVEEAVVVDVAEVGRHRHPDLVEPDLGGDVREASVAEVAIQLQRLGVVRASQIRPDGSRRC